ncbi:MAG: iron ABC transporter permease [Treponema sp.]|jgi:iron(III) transport system permease protein|nr:iron ABC transporter permease [Treponema sp.]
MINKKGFIKLLAASLIFAALDIWIYSSLLGSYRAYHEANSMKEVSLYARTVPEDPAYFDAWIAGLPEVIEGGRAMILGVDENFAFYPRAGDPAAEAIWESHKDSEEFQKGMESVYYLLPYKVSFAVNSMRVYLLPILDESGYDITGAVLMAVPAEGALAFERLLRNLSALAWLIFTVLFAAAVLARDPITGYAVIFLFAAALAFVAYPLFESFRLTFIEDGRLSFNIWKETFSPRYLSPLWGSIRLGMVTASVSTLIGFAFAFLTERTGVKRKKLIGTLATMPVISPPFSLTLSIILLFGNNGLITNQLLGLKNFSVYGLGGLVLVQTIGMFPIAYMTLSSVLKSIDSTVEDAALDLRASRLRTFLTITLPLSLPGLLSAWLLVFTNSLADFANPLLLAGSYRVLSVEAYIEVTGRSNLGGGAALSLMLLMPTLTAFFIQRYWVNKKSVVTVTGKPSTRLAELATKPVRIALTVFVSLCLVFITALYGTIVAGCFVKNWGIDYSFTLLNIGEALSRGWQSIANTVTLAAAAAPVAGIVAMAAALIVVRRSFFGKRVLEVLLMTPFAVPGTLLGISYILAFNKPPLLLVGTAAIIVINYVIRELPVGLETGAASLRQIDPAIEEAAQDLGADMSKVFTSVVLPLIRPSFLTAMSYTFVRSMTAVSAVIFLISARWYHLTVQIYNFSENLRFGLASVLSTVLIIIVLGVFGLMNLLVRDRGLTEKSIIR